ncbi:uncharacterized protein METZ01_LOCUS87148, partial [marine metagenome]
VLLAACNSSSPQSTFEAAGPVAREQLKLFWIIFWAAMIVFALVMAIMIYSIIRFRRRASDDIPNQVHGNTALEVVWTVGPIILLIGIGIITVRTLFNLDSPPSSDPLRVEVWAHQWWFEAAYPDYSITTANEIYIPVDRDVSVKLQSSDVLHSFWVPKLAGKTDVVPGRVNEQWFRADEEGVFFGQCAEFCGTAHALMKFRVVAVSEPEFNLWLDQQRLPARIPTEVAATGASVFNTKGCIVCHSVGGPDSNEIRESRSAAFLEGQMVSHGPNLTHFGSRDVFAGAILEVNEENLKKWLKDPEDLKPGNRMSRLAGAFNDPALELTESDIDALAAYLLSLE